MTDFFMEKKGFKRIIQMVINDMKQNLECDQPATVGCKPLNAGIQT